MTAVHTRSAGLDDARRRDLLFAGDLVVFRAGAGAGRFRDHVAGLVRDAFAGHDPELAQFDLDPADFLARVEQLQKLVRADETAHELFREALAATGVDLAETYWDWIHLRVLPHGEGHTHRRTTKLGFHRDTWSSNVYAQTNWWTPIRPVTAERALAFYPRYWTEPLPNTSAEWDLDVLRAGRGDPAGVRRMPLVPEPTAPVDTSGELRLVVDPGDLLCFSGAHVHASVPNTSGRTRFSVEARTVDARDVAAGRGAPNVDGAAPRTAYDWFTHVRTGTPFP